MCPKCKHGSIQQSGRCDHCRFVDKEIARAHSEFVEAIESNKEQHAKGTIWQYERPN
jgi:hypothetical protein